MLQSSSMLRGIPSHQQTVHMSHKQQLLLMERSTIIVFLSIIKVYTLTLYMLDCPHRYENPRSAPDNGNQIKEYKK